VRLALPVEAPYWPFLLVALHADLLWVAWMELSLSTLI
jgi:hypothetical protein